MRKGRLMAMGLVSLIVLQGCAAAISAGAGLGGLTLYNGHLFESEEECKTKSYPQYVKDMQTVNAEQVKQHLSLSKTETIEEYCHLKTSSATTNSKTGNNHA